MKNVVFGSFLALIAYLLLALGFVFQKKGIKIFSAERKGSDFAFWISGLILININPLFNFFALQLVPSYVVNSISALTIVFTILLSAFILKERLYKTDFFYMIMITLMIAGITFLTKDIKQVSPPFIKSLVFALLPVVLFLFLLPFLHLAGKLKAKGNGSVPKLIEVILPSITSGSMAGFMVIAMKLVQLDKGSNFSFDYLKSIYLYLFLLNGFVSFIAIQIAYKNGAMIMIAPLQYGFTVLYPIFASFFLFPLNYNITQYLLTATFTLTIFICIRGIVLKHSNQ